MSTILYEQKDCEKRIRGVLRKNKANPSILLRTDMGAKYKIAKFVMDLYKHFFIDTCLTIVRSPLPRGQACPCEGRGRDSQDSYDLSAQNGLIYRLFPCNNYRAKMNKPATNAAFRGYWINGKW